MTRFLISIFIAFSFMACMVDAPVQKQKGSSSKYGSYKSNVKGLVSIRTYNIYNQLIKEGVGFYVDKKLVVTNLDLIKGCFKAKVAPLGTDDYIDIIGYSSYNHRSNLVLLNTYFPNKNHLKLAKVSPADSVYSLFRKNRKLYTRNLANKGRIEIDSLSFIRLSDDANLGEAIFNPNHRLVGITQSRKLNDSIIKVGVTNDQIAQLIKKKKAYKSLQDLSNQSSKVYPSYKKIKGFKIKTNMGSITIKLYNETPKYRDNFIRLVSDNFYDSLLVHRVIENFLIQTGAGDTKHAKKDDMVGWKGPGYTLPLQVIPGLFHKRGAIAASKLPNDMNPKNRCDGSQFYIVSGRRFSNTELDELEKQKKIKYTPEQRNTYTTTGGAPYLDGDYTVFGEVTKGMQLVDEISNLETYNTDRPVKDVRIKDIEILYR